MGRVAYGDESIRRSGVPDPVYLLGAYIADEDQFDLADALSVYVRQDGKLHWRAHTPRAKRAVCKTISEYSAKYLVVAASPIPEGRGEERARQQALHCLSVMLEGILVWIHLSSKEGSELRMKKTRGRFPWLSVIRC